MTDDSQIYESDSLMERIHQSKPLDLLLLPFEPGIVTSDHFEEALLTLYKKRWSFLKLAFVHYFFLTPALAFPFRDLPFSLSKKLIFKRLFLLALAFSGLYWGVQTLLKFVQYAQLWPASAVVLTTCIFLIYGILGHENFGHWLEASRNIKT